MFFNFLEIGFYKFSRRGSFWLRDVGWVFYVEVGSYEICIGGLFIVMVIIRK